MTTIDKSLAIAKLKDLIIHDGNKVHNNAIYQCVNVLRNMTDTVEDVTVMGADVHGIINDDIAYVDYFDDMIYEMIIKIGKTKGLRVEELYGEDVLTNEMLSQVRYNIIAFLANVTDKHIDLSPPMRKYKLGDTIYVDNEECKIIQLGEESYGVLSLEYHNVIRDGKGTIDKFISYMRNDGSITEE